MRYIIIHNHLFKNAGSSIDWALQHCFADDFIDHRDDKKMIKWGDSYLTSFFHKNRSLKAFSTHHLRLPLPDVDSINFIIIMMFRHPIERVLSVYNFEKKQKYSDTLGAVYARDHSLREYVEWRLRPDVPPSIRNFHIKKCLDWRNFPRFPLTDADVVEVKRRVDHQLLFGAVDMFDESMALMEKQFRPFFPNIDLSYVKQNVNAGNVQSFDQKLTYLEAELGQDVMRSLLEHNKEDMRLYKYARATLLGRIAAVDNFQELLGNFNERCGLRRSRCC